MLKYFNRIVSILFNPLLVPLYGLLIILNSGTYLAYIPSEVKNIILSVYFISSIILPLSTAPLLYYQKLIRDWQFKTHKERILPLLILAGFYVFAWFMLKRIQIPYLYISFISYCSVAIILSAVISIKIKISIHMLGMGILTGLVLGLSFQKTADLHFLLILLLLLSGITGSSRLLKKETTPFMVYTGYILGFLSVFVPINFY